MIRWRPISAVLLASIMVGGMSEAARATDSESRALGQAEASSCEGRPSLYDPQALTQKHPEGVMDSFSVAVPLLRRLADIPVAFATTGDECAGPMPVYSIPSVASSATADTTHEMARRLTPILADYSRRTGLEGCARMCMTPEGLVVARLVTARSHISCVAPDSSCPAGSIPTRETIHSHPPHTVFEANEADAVGWREPGIVGKLTLTGNPNALSPEDRDAAPVWLVGANGRLIWLDRPDGQEMERP